MTARCRNRNSRTWEPVFPGCGFPVNPAAGVYGTGSLHSLEDMETVRGLNAMSQGAPAVLGIGAFAEKTLVHSGQCTKVDPEARPAAVGLLGCGVTAGLGAAINIGEMRRGENVVLVGVPIPDEKVPRIPLPDAFVSEKIALDEVERASDRMEQGEVLRSVVVL